LARNKQIYAKALVWFRRNLRAHDHCTRTITPHFTTR
jgi:hypothetical protein